MGDLVLGKEERRLLLYSPYYRYMSPVRDSPPTDRKSAENIRIESRRPQFSRPSRMTCLSAASRIKKEPGRDLCHDLLSPDPRTAPCLFCCLVSRLDQRIVDVGLYRSAAGYRSRKDVARRVCRRIAR